MKPAIPPRRSDSAALAALLAVALCGCGTAAREGAGPVEDAGSATLLDASPGGPRPADAGSPAEGGDAGSVDAGDSGGSSAADASSDAAASGPVTPQPGGAPGPGVLPPKPGNVTYLGKLAYDDPRIARDLGFTGVLNGQIVWTFGDTLLQPPTGGNALPCSTDSAALGDFAHPLAVHDKNVASNGCPHEWIPFDATELANGGGGQFAEGGTNVVEYAPGKGLVWFLKNDRGPGGTGIVGAGVATVTADPSGPIAVRAGDTMWNSFEPWWGDVGVTYDAADDHVYVFGHGPSPAQLSNSVFLAKVPAARATDVSAYEYWNAATSSWTAQRFANGQLGTLAVTRAQALFPPDALGQSNAFWSTYYNTWMLVYGTSFGYSDVMVMTAPALEGPWTPGFTIASTCPNQQCSAIRYAIAPHPEFDPTGKTLLVTWTDSNAIYAVKIEWQ